MSRIIPANEYITEHFKFEELDCPCCDNLKIFPGLFNHMALVEKLRIEFGHHIIINSGHRCKRHNEEVGGRIHSWHRLIATDVTCANPEHFKLDFMWSIAKEMPFGCVIYYYDKLFLHLDPRAIRLRMRV